MQSSSSPRPRPASTTTSTTPRPNSRLISIAAAGVGETTTTTTTHQTQSSSSSSAALPVFTTLSHVAGDARPVAHRDPPPGPGGAPAPRPPEQPGESWRRWRRGLWRMAASQAPVSRLPFAPTFVLAAVVAVEAVAPGGLQPVAAAPWLLTPLIVLYSRATVPLELPLLLVALALGTWVALLLVLADDDGPTALSTLGSLLLAMFLTLPIVPALVLDKIATHVYYRTSWFSSLTFPACLTATWAIWSRVAISSASLGSLGGMHSLSPHPDDMTQIVSILGPDAITFLFAWCGTVMALWIERWLWEYTGDMPRVDSNRRGRRQQPRRITRRHSAWQMMSGLGASAPTERSGESDALMGDRNNNDDDDDDEDNSDYDVDIDVDVFDDVNNTNYPDFLNWRGVRVSPTHQDLRNGYDDDIYQDQHAATATGASGVGSTPSTFSPLQPEQDVETLDGGPLLSPSVVGHRPPATPPGLANGLWTPTKAFASFVAAAALCGSLRSALMSGHFFQRSADGQRYPTITAGCISVLPSAKSSPGALLNSTQLVAAAGARLIVWSEAAVVVDDNPRDDHNATSSDNTPIKTMDELIAATSQLAVTWNITIGISALHYPKPKTAQPRNVFILITGTNTTTPQGDNEDDRSDKDRDRGVVIRHIKTRQFPLRSHFANSGPHASTPSPSPASSFKRPEVAPRLALLDDFTSETLVSVSAAIGFEAAVPASSAASVFARRTDIVILSANDWGPAGRLGARFALIRALETGTTVLRCASRGPTAVIGPYGDILHYEEVGPRLEDDSGDPVRTIVRFPARRRIRTVFMDFGGWLFAWGCVAFTVWIVVLLLSRRRQRNWARRIIGLGYF